MRFVVMLVALTLTVSACGRQPDPGPGDTPGATGDGPWQTPTGVTTLEDAEALAEELLADTADAVGIRGLEADDGPLVTACVPERITETTPFTSKVQVGFSVADDPDELLDRTRDHWRSQGVAGIALQFEATVPLLVGVFEDQRWQVALQINRDHGIGTLTVNTPCLPADRWQEL